MKKVIAKFTILLATGIGGIFAIICLCLTMVIAMKFFNMHSVDKTYSVVQPKAIDVLWQDASRWDSTTAYKVANINPNKFIVNIDGPYSLSTPTTGPHLQQLKGFIDTLVNVYKWKGTLVMHPDFNISEFIHDWVGPYTKDTLWTSTSYKLYADYFVLLNDTLKSNGLPTFTELLIETEGSGMTAKANVQNKIFNEFRAYLKDSSITLSATSDWHKKSFPDSADYYYAQMYDMNYPKDSGGIPALSGLNDPNEKGRVNTLVINMSKGITLTRLNKVSFIFTFAPNPKPTKKTPNPIANADAPMFGDTNAYWLKSEFTKFTLAFKDSIINASVGIWHCESPLKKW